MNADQKAWIERLDWIRNQLCRPSVTGLDAKLSTELLAKIDEQATQLAAAAATIERLTEALAKPRVFQYANGSPDEWFVRGADFVFHESENTWRMPVFASQEAAMAVARTVALAAARELEGQSDE